MHESSATADQKHCHFGHVSSPSQATQRNGRENCLFFRGCVWGDPEFRLQHGGIDRPRTEGVHTDAKGCGLKRQRAGEGQYGPLRTAVGGVTRLAHGR